MIRRPPRSTLFSLHDALPISTSLPPPLKFSVPPWIVPPARFRLPQLTHMTTRHMLSAPDSLYFPPAPLKVLAGARVRVPFRFTVALSACSAPALLQVPPPAHS